MTFRDNLRRVPGLAAAKGSLTSATRAMRSPFMRAYAPGSFYSPIPAAEDVPRVIDKESRDIPGVDLNETGQLAMLEELAKTYGELPFQEKEAGERRFHLDNEYFSYCDAIVLYSMLRYWKPARVVEVGSGFSSAVMLDTRDEFLDRSTHLTFIDPYPQRLESLLRVEDRTTSTILPRKVQEIDYAVFDALEANDILFVDSSHVVKVSSDVGHVVFNILPRLKPGVVVHFHDIPWPFEYPLLWLNAGRAWNEAYFLRSFLQFNPQYEIVFFNDFMTTFHAEKMRARLPLSMKGSSFPLTVPATSLWLRRK